MINLIIFIFATIGLTNIIVHGKIMDLIGLRPYLKEKLDPEIFSLFECYECSGFWSGLILGLFLISFNPLVILSCGFAGSFLAAITASLTLLIESKTDFVLNDDEE